MTSINTQLIQACIEGNLETVKSLVSSKADISAEDNDALICASYYGHLDVVKYLVSSNADVTAKDSDAIKWASYREYLEVIKYLVSSKADVTAEDNFALRRACSRDNLNTVKFLLSLGADYNKVTPSMKIKLIQNKYYRRWRLIVFKNWFRKVLIPLYYSPGFPGYLKGEKELKQIIS